MYQDHESHIQVHMAAMQDPIGSAVIGQNPKAQQIIGAIMAHIAEHVGFQYRQQIEQQLGMPLPPQDEKLPPQVEFALSSMMAQAAQQVLQEPSAAAAAARLSSKHKTRVVQQELQMQELQSSKRRQGSWTDQDCWRSEAQA